MKDNEKVTSVKIFTSLNHGSDLIVTEFEKFSQFLVGYTHVVVYGFDFIKTAVPSSGSCLPFCGVGRT